MSCCQLRLNSHTPFYVCLSQCVNCSRTAILWLRDSGGAAADVRLGAPINRLAMIYTYLIYKTTLVLFLASIKRSFAFSSNFLMLT